MGMRMNGRALRWATPLTAVVIGLITAPAAALGQEETQECRCDRNPRLRIFVPDSGWLRLEELDFLGARLRMEAPRMMHFFAGDGGWIGVQVATRDVEGDRGARLTSVMPGSPAEEAGLREGDQVLAVDGTSLLERLPEDREPRMTEGEWPPSRRLFRVMEDVERGDTLELRILRDGTERDISVVAGPRGALFRAGARVAALGEGGRMAPRLRALQAARMRAAARAPGIWGGGLPVRATDLNPDLASYFGTEEGALILEADESAELDLRAGDVVQAVGERPVREVSDLRRILGSYEAGESIRLDVIRKGERVTVSGVLPQR